MPNPAEDADLALTRQRQEFLDTVEWLFNLPEEQFMRQVADDAIGKADPVVSRALRDRKNITHWQQALRATAANVHQQLGSPEMAARPGYADWRSRTGKFLASVNDRLREAKLMQSRYRQGFRTPEEQALNAERSLDARRSRGEVGAVAKDRLIANHRQEFEQILAEEYELAGIELPRWLQRRVQLPKGT